MLRLLSSRILIINRTIYYSGACYVRYLQTYPNSASTSEDQQSLTISYLTNSSGLSLQRAKFASKYVHIEKTEKPDMVLQLLRDYGFTKSQMTTLISRNPFLITSDPGKTLKPKIEFFESLGIVGSDLRKILCANPRILLTSLKNKILPTVDSLREFLETDEDVIRALKRCPNALSSGFERMMANISTLRAYGVPDLHIKKLLLMDCGALLYRVDLFKDHVREASAMGFEPTRLYFIHAVRSMSVVSKSTWLRKKELLLSFGWSEGEFLSAFRLQPLFIQTSAKKMKELMEFFLTKLCLEPSDVVKYPNLFLLSLEKRIVPRCSLLEVLMSKGLIRKNINIMSTLNVSKKQFEDKFFTSYKEDFPELVKAYKLESGFKGFRDQIDKLFSKESSKKMGNASATITGLHYSR